MDDTGRANLAESLHTAAADLSAVANTVPDLGTDDEIEQQAEALDHIADSAREGAIILRSHVLQSSRPPLPRENPPHWPLSATTA